MTLADLELRKFEFSVNFSGFRRFRTQRQLNEWRNQYCQWQRCKHVELEQFLVCFRVARVSQRQLDFLVCGRVELAQYIPTYFNVSYRKYKVEPLAVAYTVLSRFMVYTLLKKTAFCEWICYVAV